MERPALALLVALAVALPGAAGSSASATGPPPARVAQGSRAEDRGAGPAGPAASKAASKVAREAGPVVPVTREDQGGTRLAPTVRSPRATWIRRLYPQQSRASQDASDPATQRWALLIGINDYAGSTQDTIGSRQDAQSLRQHLLNLHWRRDHIMLLTDRNATASRILDAIKWLAAKTDEHSTVVFHYAGHEKPLRTDVDNDREARDVALWAADNRLVPDGALATALARVRVARMWIHLATCRAGGFDDPGMLAAGRIITYSSPEREYSYEDPKRKHSVFGYYVIVRGLMRPEADSDRNGRVSVEEAFRFARPLVRDRTGNRQHPFVVDHAPGSFLLQIPPPPARPSSSSSQPQPPASCPLPVCP